MGSLEKGVNNMNMTDQVNENSRPGSSQAQNPPGGGGFQQQLTKTPSKADQQRLEKITALREKQNTERLKKLEELKEHAAAAAKLREEQDTRRRRHFLELSKKDEERRKAAEERRRLLEEERQTALVAKFESKRMTSSMMSTSSHSKSNSNERKYAFGSCTPRLIENYDGFLWKSQYNLNFASSPSSSGAGGGGGGGGGSSSDNSASVNSSSKQGRATSAQDLLSQKRRNMMTASMYDWDQTRTTIDNPLVHKKSHRDDEGSQNRLYFFCGRRKTDLTPTIPIKRDLYGSSSSPRSTATSGRLSSRSMSRLDKVSLAGPGGLRTPSPSSSSGGGGGTLLSAQRRSKSTNQLSKLTRTELLRQEKANKRREGFSSTMSTRPPSSLSSTAAPSLMTSSTHSAVNMRSSRPSARKPRPVSVHVTGVSSTHSTAATTPTAGSEDTNKRFPPPRRIIQDENRRKADLERLATPRMRTPTSEERDLTKKSDQSEKSRTTPTPKQQEQKDFSTIRRSASKSKKMDEILGKKDSKDSNKTADKTEKNLKDNRKSPSLDREKGERKSPVDKPEKATLEKPEKAEKDSEEIHVKKTDPSGSQDLQISLQAPAVAEALNLIEGPNGTPAEVSGPGGDLGGDVGGARKEEETSPPSGNQLINFEEETIEKEVVKSNGISTEELKEEVKGGKEGKEEVKEEIEVVPKLKITNEEQAKAALAEKRRLAREAQEREAARLEELQREEEERERKAAEEQERLLEETRKAEEERLQRAIRERELREEEEKKRAEEEEVARIEKEAAEKEAAKEVERLRLEMEERLKREEEERVERRRRVEAIMSRTRVANRKSGIQDDNQQENLKNVQKQEEVSPGEVIPTGLNNETFNNLQNSSIINNLTNNNTTTSNSNSSTLISFDDNTNHQQFNNYNNQSRQPEPEILDGAFTTSATTTTSVLGTGGNSPLEMDSSVNNASSTDGAAAFPAPESAAATIQDLLS